MQETMLEFLKITAEAAGFSEPRGTGEIVGAVIGTFLSLLGIIFLILTIYGGFVWMTSGGNETKVLKAKETLKNATIGLIIIVSAYAITRFVFDSILQATA